LIIFRAAIFATAVAILALANGCSSSCRDELNASVFVDLTNANGNACDIVLANGSQHLTYHCDARSPQCAVDDVHESCASVGNAPPLKSIVRYQCGFTLKTQSADEAQSLQNALGGRAFSVTATCDGQEVDHFDAAISTHVCEG
jgi:hypothetical protein